MKIIVTIEEPTSEFLSLLASLPQDGTVEVQPVITKPEPRKKQAELKQVQTAVDSATDSKPVGKPSITFESVRTWITDNTKGETEADEAMRVKIKAALVKYIPETEPKKTLSKLPTESLEKFFHDITH